MEVFTKLKLNTKYFPRILQDKGTEVCLSYETRLNQH